MIANLLEGLLLVSSVAYFVSCLTVSYVHTKVISFSQIFPFEGWFRICKLHPAVAGITLPLLVIVSEHQILARFETVHWKSHWDILVTITNGYILLASVALYSVPVDLVSTSRKLEHEVNLIKSENRSDLCRFADMDFIDRWFYTRLKNPKDASFVRPLLNITLMCIPFFLAILFPGLFAWSLLMLLKFLVDRSAVIVEVIYHWNLHHRLFVLKEGFEANFVDRLVLIIVEFILVYVVGPLYAYVPHIYPILHKLNHHKENNGVADYQTTITYDRSSVFDYCMYSLLIAVNTTFCFSVVPYFKRKYASKLPRIMFAIATGHIWYWGMLVAVGYWVHWTSTVFHLVNLALIGPALAESIWKWHVFADPDNPDLVCSNTIVFENPIYDLWSDAYHIEHHKYPNSHWSTLGQKHQADKLHYQALPNTFDATMLRQPFLYWLWNKQYSKLVSFYRAPVEGTTITEQQLVAMIEHRTKPIHRATTSKWKQQAEVMFMPLVALLYL